MPSRPQQPTKTTASAIALALIASAALAAGCGSSSSPTKARAQAAHPTAVPSSPDVGQASAQSGPSATTKASPASQAQKHGHGQQVQQARSKPGSNGAGVGETGGKQPNPCKLVSTSEAAAITGGAVVGQLEAPLGPTCIYRLGSAQGEVTLAVESMNLSQVARQMRNRSPVSVQGRRGYCGTLGTQMLFLPLTAGRILNVTAPCAQAQRFAAAALIHITA